MTSADLHYRELSTQTAPQRTVGILRETVVHELFSFPFCRFSHCPADQGGRPPSTARKLGRRPQLPVFTARAGQRRDAADWRHNWSWSGPHLPRGPPSVTRGKRMSSYAARALSPLTGS